MFDDKFEFTTMNKIEKDRKKSDRALTAKYLSRKLLTLFLGQFKPYKIF